MRQLIFKIETDGTVTVDAEGFTGGECLTAAKPILDSLGETKELEERLNVRQENTG